MSEPRPSPASRRRIVDVCSFTIAASALAVVLSPALRMNFGIIDDHEIVGLLGRDRDLPFRNFFGAVADPISEPMGRFRPVYWVLRVAETVLWGRHVELWYLSRIGLAIITMGAIFVVVRRFVPAPVAALLALIPFAGPQAEVWYRLGPNEAYAMPLLCVGIAGATSLRATERGPASTWWAFLAVALAAGSKESFLPVSGILLTCAIAQGWRAYSLRDRVAVGLPLLLTLAFGAGLAVKVAQYGDQYRQTRDLDSAYAFTRFAFEALDLGWNFTIGMLILLALRLFITKRNPGSGASRGSILLLVSIVGIALLSQIGFYAGAPHVGRYLYPLALVPVIFWAGVTARVSGTVRSVARRLLLVVVSIAVAVPVVVNLAQVGRSTSAAVRTTRSFAAELAKVEATVRAAGVSVVVVQPSDLKTDTERVLALSRYLSADLGVAVMTTQAEPGQDLLSRSLAETLADWSVNGTDFLRPYDPNEPCVAVILGDALSVCSSSVPGPG